MCCIIFSVWRWRQLRWHGWCICFVPIDHGCSMLDVMHHTWIHGTQCYQTQNTFQLEHSNAIYQSLPQTPNYGPPTHPPLCPLSLFTHRYTLKISLYQEMIKEEIIFSRFSSRSTPLFHRITILRSLAWFFQTLICSFTHLYIFTTDVYHWF